MPICYDETTQASMTWRVSSCETGFMIETTYNDAPIGSARFCATPSEVDAVIKGDRELFRALQGRVIATMSEAVC